MNKKAVVVLFAICLVLTGLSTVNAMDLGISPPDVTLNLAPGETYQGEVFVLGSEKESVDVNAYAMDWALTSAGDYQFLPAGTLKRSVSPWVSFSDKNFSLPPQGGQKVTYAIHVPNNASGSYWGVIMFGTKPKPLSGKDPVQIAVAGRVAFVIRVDIRGTASGSGSLERCKMAWDGTQKKISAALKIKNYSNSFLRPKGYMELTNLQGQKVGTIPFKTGLVLPDYIREFQLEDTHLVLEPGMYIGLAIVDLGDRNLKAVQSTIEIK